MGSTSRHGFQFLGERLRALHEWFAPGAVVLALLAMSGVSALTVLRGPAREEAVETTLEFWLFARTHERFYKEVIPRFEEQHPGVKVSMHLSRLEAMSRRLQAAFLSQVGGPDVIEMEISYIGRFFSGPLESVGFLDLTERIECEGLDDIMVKRRFQPWSSRGRIFGIPHDVHPVVLVYNREVFEKYGIDIRSIETWDEFEAAAIPMCVDRDGDGQKEQYAFELDSTDHARFSALLLQAGGGYFDESGRLSINDDVAISVLAKFIQWTEGPDRIATGFPWGMVTNQALIDGVLGACLVPDWRAGLIMQDVPVMEGKFDAMPLPAWEPGGRRTSIWGGTMLGISKMSDQQDLAWEFMKFLYFDPSDLASRFRDTGIIPPVRTAWSAPVFHEPWPFFNQRRMGDLFVELAPEIPPLTMTPFSVNAQDSMKIAMVRGANEYRRRGFRDAEEIAREVLDDVAADLSRLIARNPFHRAAALQNTAGEVE